MAKRKSRTKSKSRKPKKQKGAISVDEISMPVSTTVNTSTQAQSSTSERYCINPEALDLMDSNKQPPSNVVPVVAPVPVVTPVDPDAWVDEMLKKPSLYWNNRVYPRTEADYRELHSHQCHKIIPRPPESKDWSDSANWIYTILSTYAPEELKVFDPKNVHGGGHNCSYERGPVRIESSSRRTWCIDDYDTFTDYCLYLRGQSHITILCD